MTTPDLAPRLNLLVDLWREFQQHDDNLDHFNAINATTPDALLDAAATGDARALALTRQKLGLPFNTRDHDYYCATEHQE